MMMSRRSRTSLVAQTNRTNEVAQKNADVTSKNGMTKRRFGTLQSNSDAYGAPETG